MAVEYATTRDSEPRLVRQDLDSYSAEVAKQTAAVPMRRGNERFLEGRWALVVRVLTHPESGLDGGLAAGDDLLGHVVQPWRGGASHDRDDRGLERPDLLCETYHGAST